MKQITEKANKFKIEIGYIFVDFRQTCTSDERNELMEALKELEVIIKL